MSAPPLHARSEVSVECFAVRRELGSPTNSPADARCECMDEEALALIATSLPAWMTKARRSYVPQQCCVS